MNSVTGLSLGRIGIGLASLVKPELVQSTMGTTTSNPLLTQWFGSREVALGAATLLARGGARRSMVLIGMAVDGADAATAYQAVEKQLMPRTLGLAFAGVAGGAVLAGLLGLRAKEVVPEGARAQARKVAKTAEKTSRAAKVAQVAAAPKAKRKLARV